MSSTDSPAAARRRVRLAIRKAREATQLTQGDVAEQLEWSLSKVNRIENGEVTISATDLKAVMTLLEITGRAITDQLVQDARTARKRGWWDNQRYRAHVTPATLQLIQLEAEATAIRCFQPTLVPGVMQIPAYSRAILEFWTDMSEEARDIRLEVRAKRRSQLFDSVRPPAYFVALDESVVLRRVGGTAVMVAQLESVLEMMTHPAVIVRIVPLVEGATTSLQGDFTILDFADDENAVLYREAALADQIVDAREVVDRYRSSFERMWEVALTAEESTRLIRASAATMLASLDRTNRNM